MTYSAGGAESFGLVADGGVIDAGAALGADYPTLRAAIAGGKLGDIANLAGNAPTHSLNDVTCLPVIPDPEKILCIGINYAAHMKETGRDLPQHPMIFTRYPNSVVGHDRPIIRPQTSEKFDFEGELAVIIGKSCRHVKKADALSCIAGYSIFNDGTIRDWQRHTIQFIPGKNFWQSGSFGPWMVTPDEIPDPAALTLETRLNGVVMQHTGTDDLIFDIPTQIEYLSTFTRLEPGDVIATGTPGGVGAYREPPLWMKAGDTLEIEISSIGTLRNPVEDE